jgi:formate hydrogenlyase subunit 3/multisubunit Na+/H+ antiporter MnhD subunit
MTGAWAIASLILGPLVAAALAFALPRWGRWLGLSMAALAGAAALQLARHLAAGGALTHRVGGWGPPLGIDLRADGLSVLMLLVTALVGLAVSLYAQRYFDSAHGDAAAHRARYFWPLFLFLWTALNALFLSADIFNLYVTLELLGFGAVTLVALDGKRAALTAALRYLVVSLSASLFYLLGVGLIYGQCATVDLPSLAAGAHGGPVVWVALGLMTGGLVAKAALFPMHFWLPPAHANAPAPVSALLSALVVKGSFYILLRLWFEAFPGLMTPVVARAFGVLGAAAIIYGSVQALFQARLKLLVAYSTVAQLGYLFLVFPLASSPAGGLMAWSGGLTLLAAHACAKAAMFLTAGNILHAAGHDRIKDLDGITHTLPVSVFAFALSGISLIGLPPSGGFAGKWLLLSAGVAQGQWGWVAIILAGSLLAAAYVMRVLTSAFTRVATPPKTNAIPPVMEWTALGLALVATFLGFAAHALAGLLKIGAPVAGSVLTGGLAP